MIAEKKIDIFCGTGGVGKTTISTSRALYLAGLGKKVLLITIDPAKRLKQVLGIPDDKSEAINNVELEAFNINSSGICDALLLNPRKTLERILKSPIENDILINLSRPYGGLNEIMAVLELKYHLDSKKYDCIVLDTPPGQHFIDFLEASRKIKHFFDKSFMDIFDSYDDRNKKQKFFTKIITSGIDKLLSYLEAVTGKSFVNEFIEAIHLLYNYRMDFIEGIKVEELLMDQDISNWFLVTSADQIKDKEATTMIESTNKFMHNDKYIIINKSWSQYIGKWNPTSQVLNELKDKLTNQQKNITNITKNNQTIEMPEIFENAPLKQIIKLISYWENKNERIQN